MPEVDLLKNYIESQKRQKEIIEETKKRRLKNENFVDPLEDNSKNLIESNKEISIPDNGSYRFILNKEKKIKKFLDRKTGWITAQSDNPFVNGWYFEFCKNGSVGGDHLF